MEYDEVYDLIARYARETLEHFADTFSRFPCGENAVIIANALAARAEFYRDVDGVVAKKLASASAEILSRDK